MDSQVRKGEENIVSVTSVNKQSTDPLPDHRSHRCFAAR